MDESNPKPRQREGTIYTSWGSPGTGKTSRLLDQWETIALQNPEFGPAFFLAATGAGAEQILSQASERTGRVGELVFPRVVTPALIANFILRHGGAHIVGLNPDYTIWSSTQAHQMFAEAVRATPAGRALGPPEIHRLYRRYRSRKAGFQDGGIPGDITGPTAAYEVLQDTCGCLDIDDLVPLAVQALGENAQLRSLFCLPEEVHLLVDDFHLLSPWEVQLALLIAGDARDASVAIDQNLPTAGGLIGLIKRLASLRARYSHIADRNLEHTHRHGGSLARFVHHFTTHQDTRGLFSTGFAGTRPEGTLPVIARASGDPAKIAELVHDWAQEMLLRGYDWKDLACVCLDAALADRLRVELDHRSVPCNILGRISPERGPVEERALGLLTWVLNQRDRRAFSDAVFTSSAGIPDVVMRQVVGKIFDEHLPAGIDIVQAIDLLAQDFSPDDTLHKRLMWAADAHREVTGLVDDGDGSASVAALVGKVLAMSGLDPEECPTGAARTLLDRARRFDTEQKGPAALREFLDLSHLDINLNRSQGNAGLTLVSPGYEQMGYWPAACIIDTPAPGEDERERNRRIFAALTRATEELVYFVGNEDGDRFADPGEGYLNALQVALEQAAAGESGPFSPEAPNGPDPERETPPADSWNHEVREEPDGAEENGQAVCVLPPDDIAGRTGPAQEPEEDGQRRPATSVGPEDPGTLQVRPQDAVAGRARRDRRDVRRDELAARGYAPGREKFPISIDWPCIVPTIIVGGLIVALAVHIARALMG